MRIYEKVHLVVATPGRILDLMEKQVCNIFIVRCLHITIFFLKRTCMALSQNAAF